MPRTPNFEKAAKERDLYLKAVEKHGYQPWLTVTSARKMSRRSSVDGIKSPGRSHQLLSDLENYVFHDNESNPLSADINEQFPLLDFELVYEISQEMGVRYPMDDDGNAVIMSIDQVVQWSDTQGGPNYLEAQTVKYTTDLIPGSKSTQKIKRNLEKLEIERRYCARIGVPYKIRTEKSVARLRSENLEFIRPAAFELHQFHEYLDPLCMALIDAYLIAPKAPLKTLLDGIAANFSLESPLVTQAFKYAVWSQRIPYDHSYEFDLLDPLHLIKVA